MTKPAVRFTQGTINFDRATFATILLVLILVAATFAFVFIASQRETQGRIDDFDQFLGRVSEKVDENGREQKRFLRCIALLPEPRTVQAADACAGAEKVP